MNIQQNVPVSDWVEKDFNPVIVPFMQPAYLPINSNSFSKIDYFRQYVNDDLIRTLVDKSNEMHLSRDGKNLKLSLPECYIYLDIPITGYGMHMLS